jgi:hypothetical protein
MNTNSSQKTISNALAAKVGLTALEILALIGIGMIGVLLHAKFRVPLRLPGHHGVVYMALLIGGRLLSKKPYASSLSSVGAALMLMFPLGFKDPFMPLIYLLPGFITDLGWRIFGNSHKKFNIWMLALVCGVSYMTIPLSRIIITTITGFPYGSFITGFIWPTLTHFVFGFAGGLAGTALIRAFSKNRTQ